MALDICLVLGVLMGCTTRQGVFSWMRSVEGCMYVEKNVEFSDNMVPYPDILHSLLQKLVIPYVESSRNELFAEQQIVLADFSTADGRVAIEVFKQIIELLRRYDTEKEFTLIFEDHIGTDFQTLLKNISEGGLMPSIDGVYALASSTTMYKQCLPSNSAHIIFSLFGSHYLSKRPCAITNGIFTTDCNAKEGNLYSEQAAKDWKLFLKNRSKELVPGGFMFLICVSGRYITGCSELSAALKSMVTDGILSKKELSNISVTFYSRSEEELRLPFLECAKEIDDLELLHLELTTKTIAKTKNGKMGLENAVKVMKMIRTFCYLSIVNNLDPKRSENEKTKITDELFRRHILLLSEMTEDCQNDHARIAIRKKFIIQTADSLY